MAMAWIEPVLITPSTINSWIDVDLSSYVPSNATGVIFHARNTSGSDFALGIRKNGSTDARTQQLGRNTHCWGVIGVDESKIIELYVGDDVYVRVYLVGYFKWDTFFFTNAIDKSPATTGSWVDIDISSDTGSDTAIAGIFEITGNPSTYYSVGLRKNGSTDARTATIYGHNCFGAIIGVDGSEVCEGYIGDSSVKLYLVGYFESGATLNTNATDISPAAINEWTDLAALPDGSTGALIEIAPTDDTVWAYGLRKNGSSESFNDNVNKHAWGLVECDTSGIIEALIAYSTVKLFLIGYASPPPSPEFKPFWAYNSNVMVNGA